MLAATVNEVLSRLGLDPRGTAPFPRSTASMLMHKADRLVSSPDWTYEPKWDGFRVIATVRDGSVRLLSRNGHLFTRLFGPVSDALRSFPASLVLDGEDVAITDEGRPDFEALQQRLRPRDGTLPGHLCRVGGGGRPSLTCYLRPPFQTAHADFPHAAFTEYSPSGGSSSPCSESVAGGE